MLSFYPLSARAICGTPLTTYLPGVETLPIFTILPSGNETLAIFGLMTENPIPDLGDFLT